MAPAALSIGEAALVAAGAADLAVEAAADLEVSAEEAASVQAEAEPAADGNAVYKLTSYRFRPLYGCRRAGLLLIVIKRSVEVKPQFYYSYRNKFILNFP